MPDYLNNTSLLLHCNGNDGEKFTSDSSIYSHSISFFGNAQIDTDQKKFGTASLLLGGPSSGDYLTVPNHVMFRFTTESFSLEFQGRFSQSPGATTMFMSSIGGGGFQWLLSYTAMRFYIHGWGTVVATVPFTPVLGQFYHIAVCREGTNLRFFIDGIQLGATLTIPATIGASTGLLYIGHDGGALSRNFPGSMDEVRIFKNEALYTSNFTPPVSEFYTTLTISKELSFVYNIGINISKELNFVYDIHSRVAKELPMLYSIRNVCGTECQFIYRIGELVSKSLNFTYNVYQEIGKELVFSYNLGESISKELEFNYDLIAPVSKSLNFTYNIGSLVSKELEFNYDLVSAVSKELNFQYNIRAKVARQIRFISNILGTVAKELEFNYNVRTIVGKDCIYVYNIRNAVFRELEFEYRIRNTVGKEVEFNYNILEALLKTVYKELVFTYNIPFKNIKINVVFPDKMYINIIED
ncbi:MAG: LamG domain-containing protein [Patescibacteria group bacterium]|jgi:hypothetical protein